MRARDPVANLLRIVRRDLAEPTLRFSDEPRRASRAEPADGRQKDHVTREDPIVFPEPIFRPDRASSTPPVETRRETTEDHADQRWPELHRSSETRPIWPDVPARSEQREAHFTARDNRWPELPPFEEYPAAAVLSDSDEAALVAEQIGGTWSA